MARQKKPVHRVQMTEGKRNIIRQLLENTIFRLLKISRMLGRSLRRDHQRNDGAEMDDHLGYEKLSVRTTTIIETAINASR